MNDEVFGVRRVASIAPDAEFGSGSIVRLDCGHLLWCALGPDEIKTLKTVHCAACVCEYLDSRRPARISASKSAN